MKKRAEMRNLLSRFVTTIVILGVLLAAVPAQAAGRAAAPTLLVYYAKPGGLTSGACDDWSVACELSFALSLTTNWPSLAYRVYAEEGTYTPTNGSDRFFTFPLRSGVRIFGGYSSIDHTRDPASLVTILSGDLNGDDGLDFTNNGDNSYHVVVVSGTESNALDGLTITAGNADGSGSQYDGGGLFNSGSPILTNLIIAGNFATGAGGGIHSGYDAYPTMTDVTFSDNQAALGGGLYVYASITLTRVTFVGNHATTSGGGLYIQTYGPALANVTFHDNDAAVDGGGIYNHDGVPSLRNITMSNNQATYNGGALYSTNTASGPTLTNVVLWGNSADNTGNEVYMSGGNASIDHGVVQGGCPAGVTCTSLISADPMLGPLQDNGGLTHTMALWAGSSAIDTGDDVVCAGLQVGGLDQRSVARPEGAHCDIGAYEFIYEETVGITGAGTFFLRNANAAGPADKTFGFGWAGPTPLVGDWNGDGAATVGIDDNGWFFLRNSNSAGPADLIYQYGWAGATPLMGDWDGDGDDTVGIYDGSTGTFFLRNSNSPGAADAVFSFGWSGPTPLVGDWDGNGTDTIGLYTGGTFFLRNTNSSGPADLTFAFGWPGPSPIVGDWNGDGVTTVGIDSAGTFFLRNTNSAGPADLTFNYGWAGATPLAGTWDQVP